MTDTTQMSCPTNYGRGSTAHTKGYHATEISSRRGTMELPMVTLASKPTACPVNGPNASCFSTKPAFVLMQTEAVWDKAVKSSCAK